MSQGSSRFDWYQTDAEVCINYFRKNLKPEDVRVEFETDSVTIFAVTENGEEPLKTFHLLHSVSKSDSSFRVSSVKVELRLRKLTAARWDRLESDSSLTDTEKHTIVPILCKMPRCPTTYPLGIFSSHWVIPWVIHFIPHWPGDTLYSPFDAV
ncbi:unnamed protein product [Dicrocoelium dendriticum]|nr:unnamed protein product [Dicrocoelium dendriticum]